MRKQLLVLAVCTAGSWALILAAVAGGYQAGAYVVSWIADPPRAQADGSADPGDLDPAAEELSKISPAAGADETAKARRFDCFIR